MDPTNPPRPAVVQAALSEAELTARVAAVEHAVNTRTAQNAADLLKMGADLIEIKALVKARGGSWLDWIHEHLPRRSPRSVQYWMRAAKYATVAHLEGELRRATHPTGESDVLTPEELAEIEDWDPADPTPGQGDAAEGEKPKKPKEPKEPKGRGGPKPAGGQQQIDMEPDITAARQAVNECRDTADAFADRVKQVLESKAGDELRKQFRLNGITVRDDGTLPTFEPIRRLVDKVAQQGFPA